MRDALEHIARQFEYITFADLTQAERTCVRIACVALGWDYRSNIRGELILERKESSHA